MLKYLTYEEAEARGWRSKSESCCSGCYYHEVGRTCRANTDISCCDGIIVDQPKDVAPEKYPECRDHCGHWKAKHSCHGCNVYEYGPAKVSEIHSEVPCQEPVTHAEIQTAVIRHKNAELKESKEVDKKQADITKAKPGQMAEEFNLALLAVSEVTRYGMEKYNQAGSWKHAKDDLVKYHDAMMRHYLLAPSESHDDESGYLHLIHAAWNILAIVQMKLEFKMQRPRDLDAAVKCLPGLTKQKPKWYKE